MPCIQDVELVAKFEEEVGIEELIMNNE